MPLIEKIGTWQIWESDGHGRSTGQPGNYNKATTGIQVRNYTCGGGGYLLKKTFNFPVNDRSKRAAKIFLAREFISSNIVCENCGEKLNPKKVKWLELSQTDGNYYANIPKGHTSQGSFSFGTSCATKELNKTISAIKQNNLK